MSLNYKGVVVENKARYANEKGGSKLTYNFATDPRLKRGHNYGIIYVTSLNKDENIETGKSHQKKNIQSNKNQIKGKNYLNQSKKKEEKNKKINYKTSECGVCTTKITAIVHPIPITFEEIVQTDSI